MRGLVIAANTLGWPVIQLSIARLVTRMDSRRFAHDNFFFRVRPWEVRVYRNNLALRWWKQLLPDGAPWVGGSFRKGRLEKRDEIYLRQFVVETRRGEAAHWVMLACWPVFCLWNPPWAWMVMVAYAVFANLPCILVQRYNRGRMQALLSSPLHAGSRSGAAAE